MRLYLIRHAHAGQRDPDDPDDALRPLSRKGRRQAQTLARACALLELRFDRLFSSPLIRARETAQALSAYTKGERLEFLEELADDAYTDLVEKLEETLHPGDATIGLVGHEPFLSELASFLLTGQPGLCGLNFRKGMLVELAGPLSPGRLELKSALTSSQLKRLSRQSP